MIKVRLDPLIKYINMNSIFEYCYGNISLDWDDLSDVEENICVYYMDFETQVKTQIYWMLRDGEFHFHCEELPLYEEINKGVVGIIMRFIILV